MLAYVGDEVDCVSAEISKRSLLRDELLDMPNLFVLHGILLGFVDSKSGLPLTATVCELIRGSTKMRYNERLALFAVFKVICYLICPLFYLSPIFVDFVNINPFQTGLDVAPIENVWRQE